MKNQYFGDVNDYMKYSLIRSLSGGGKLKTAICWMLTPNDNRSDGRFIDYLQQPDVWRCYDSTLFDWLKGAVISRQARNISEIKNSSILPGCRFYSEILDDNSDKRARYFDDFLKISKDCDLVFYDPDNGLEIKSKPIGRKDSSKFLFWNEVIATFESGCSVLIYQHFPRVPRNTFIRGVAEELFRRLNCSKVISFRTPKVLFILASQQKHVDFLTRQSSEVGARWDSSIEVGFY